MEGLPAKYYVKALQYNGSVTPGSVFSINPQAAVQELQIVVSDKPASIYGTAGTDTSVLSARWPAELVSNYPYELQETATDSSGGFAFNRLQPGTFRVIAVPSALRPILEEPGRMLALFNAAESIEVGEGSGVLKALVVQAVR
jgi:hypothetical protein